MRRFPISWDKTLSALGFRRNVKRIKRDYYRRKNNRIESLEQRAMLSVAPTNHWSFDTDAMAQVGSVDPSFVGGTIEQSTLYQGGGALRLDGTDDYVELNHSDLHNPFSNYTITAWFKADDLNGTQVIFEEGGLTKGIALRLNGSTLEGAIRSAASGDGASTQKNVSVDSAVNAGEWHFVALTYEGGSSLNLYLDGVLVDTNTNSIAPLIGEHTDPANIGKQSTASAFGDGDGSYFDGLIDEVKVYDGITLSENDIQQHAANVHFIEDRIQASEDAYVRGGVFANQTHGEVFHDLKTEQTWGHPQNNVQKLIAKKDSDANNAREALLRFDLSSLNLEEIVDAKLDLTVLPHVTTGVVYLQVHEVTDTWDELGVTWNNKPSQGTHILSFSYDFASGNANDNSVSLDLTSFLKNLSVGTTSISFLLSETTNGIGFPFASSEHPTETGPELVIKKKVFGQVVDSLEVAGGELIPGQEAHISATFAGFPESVRFYYDSNKDGNLDTSSDILFHIDTERNNGWKAVYDTTNSFTHAGGELAKIFAVPMESGTPGAAVEVAVPVAVVSQTSIAITNDAYARKLQPDTAYGASGSANEDELRVKRTSDGYHRQSFLEIDISQFDANVTKADLKITPIAIWDNRTSFDLLVDAIPTDGSFGEETLTWNNRTTPAGDLFGGEFTIPSSSVNQEINLDITKLIQEAIANNESRLLVRFSGIDIGHGITFASSEHATLSGPKLVVTQSNTFIPGEDIVVDSLVDENDGNYSAGNLSLREAIEIAKTIPGVNTITFDTTLLSTPQTITVNQPLAIDDEEAEVHVSGPGADLLTVRGGFDSSTQLYVDSVFVIETDTTTTLSGLKVSGGRYQGIQNDGILQLDQVEVSVNDGIGINSGHEGVLTIDRSTVAFNDGGGIRLAGTEAIINSTTITGNEGFGGIEAISGAAVEITNATITNNDGNDSPFGGGINAQTSSEITIYNSIIVGNTNDQGYSDIAPDAGIPIWQADFSGSNNLIGEAHDAVLTDGINPVDLELQPLGYYGGSTRTIALGENSIAIDAGSNGPASSLATDQRGLQRFAGSAIDIGAYETTDTIVVNTISDAVDLSDGVTSLREAIELAEQAPGENIITFDDSLFPGGAQTILLGDEDGNGSVEGTEASSQLYIDSSLSIIGPGSDQLTINGGNAARVVLLASDQGLDVAISGLTITGGLAGDGAGLFSRGNDLDLDSVTITGNYAVIADPNNAGNYLGQSGSNKAYGGGIYFAGQDASNESTLTITNSQIDNNYAGMGGGIYGHTSYANINIDSTTIDTNTAFQSLSFDANNDPVVGPRVSAANYAHGGGISLFTDYSLPSGHDDKVVAITNSTISNNLAIRDAGGLSAGGGSRLDLDISNSTFSGNEGYQVGGIKLRAIDATITNSTITDNHTERTNYGGGLHSDLPSPANITLNNSIVAGNTAGSGNYEKDILGELVGTSIGNIIDDWDQLATTIDVNNQVNIDLTNLDLQPLADYGGPTPTHALGENSIAIDTGVDSLATSFDQRGVSRVDIPGIGTSISDIGAFEFSQPSLQMLPEDALIFVADEGPISLLPEVTFSGYVDQIQLEILNRFDSYGELLLSTYTPTTATIEYLPSLGLMTISGASDSEIQQILRGIQYNNTRSGINTYDRGIQISLLYNNEVIESRNIVVDPRIRATVSLTPETDFSVNTRQLKEVNDAGSGVGYGGGGSPYETVTASEEDGILYAGYVGYDEVGYHPDNTVYFNFQLPEVIAEGTLLEADVTLSSLARVFSYADKFTEPSSNPFSIFEVNDFWDDIASGSNRNQLHEVIGESGWPTILPDASIELLAGTSNTSTDLSQSIEDVIAQGDDHFSVALVNQYSVPSSTPGHLITRSPYWTPIVSSDSSSEESHPVLEVTGLFKNDTIVAGGDSYTTSSNSRISRNSEFGVLRNDRSPSNLPLSAELLEGPEFGDLIFNEDGSFVYQPGSPDSLPENEYPDFAEFTYRVYNGINYSNPAKVIILISDKASYQITSKRDSVSSFYARLGHRSPDPLNSDPIPLGGLAPSYQNQYFVNDGVMDEILENDSEFLGQGVVTREFAATAGLGSSSTFDLIPHDIDNVYLEELSIESATLYFKSSVTQHHISLPTSDFLFTSEYGYDLEDAYDLDAASAFYSENGVFSPYGLGYERFKERNVENDFTRTEPLIGVYYRPGIVTHDLPNGGSVVSFDRPGYSRPATFRNPYTEELYSYEYNEDLWNQMDFTNAARQLIRSAKRQTSIVDDLNVTISFGMIQNFQYPRPEYDIGFYGGIKDVHLVVTYSEPVQEYEYNAAPVFRSERITEAIVGTPYEYTSQATDEEGDDLTFSIDQVIWPEGYTPSEENQFLIDDYDTFENDTRVDEGGNITWAPPADLVGQTITLVEKVVDTAGNESTRDINIYVAAPPENHAPAIISNPEDSFIHPLPIPDDGNLDNVTPGAIQLTLGEGEKVTTQVSITPNITESAADIIFVVDASGSMQNAISWLAGVIPTVEERLVAVGVGSGQNKNQYGLVLFNGHAVPLGLIDTAVYNDGNLPDTSTFDYINPEVAAGPDQPDGVDANLLWGTAEQLAIAVKGLSAGDVASHNGYGAITRALSSDVEKNGIPNAFSFRSIAATDLILVSDESSYGGPHSHPSEILDLLTKSNDDPSDDIVFNSIINSGFTGNDSNGNIDRFMNSANEWFATDDGYAVVPESDESPSWSVIDLLAYGSDVSESTTYIPPLIWSWAVKANFRVDSGTAELAKNARVLFGAEQVLGGLEGIEYWYLQADIDNNEWYISYENVGDISVSEKYYLEGSEEMFAELEPETEYEVELRYDSHRFDLFVNETYHGSVRVDDYSTYPRLGFLGVGTNGSSAVFDYLQAYSLNYIRIEQPSDPTPYPNQGRTLAATSLFKNDFGFKDGSSYDVKNIGIDTSGFAYRMDGEGGYSLINNPNIAYGDLAQGKQESQYFGLAVGTGGTAWNLDTLRGKYTPSHIFGSFSNSFADGIARKVLQQQTPRSIVSTGALQVDHELSGIDLEGPTFKFDVSITGDGKSHAFDLLFVPEGYSEGDVIHGIMPVSVGGAYTHDFVVDDYENDIDYFIDWDPDYVSEDGHPLNHGARLVSSGRSDYVNDRLIWYPPVVTEDTEFEFNVIVRDSVGNIGKKDWTVTVRPASSDNDAPTISLDSYEFDTLDGDVFDGMPVLPVAKELRSYSHQIQANDENDDNLRYYLVPTVLNDGSEIVVPSWLAINRTTGELSGKPGSSDLGKQFVTVVATDNRRLFDDQGDFLGEGKSQQIFVISVDQRDYINIPPSVDSIPSLVFWSEDGLNYQINANDFNQDELTYSIYGPEGIMVHPDKGIISWSPKSYQTGEDYPITVIVNDGIDTSSRTFYVHALPKNRVPLITAKLPDGLTFIDYHQPLTATDADGDYVRFKLLSSPAGMRILTEPDGRQFLHWPASPAVPGDPTITAGTYDITIAATDGVNEDVERVYQVAFEDSVIPQLFYDGPPSVWRVGVQNQASLTYKSKNEILDFATAVSLDEVSQSEGMSLIEPDSGTYIDGFWEYTYLLDWQPSREGYHEPEITLRANILGNNILVKGSLDLTVKPKVILGSGEAPYFETKILGAPTIDSPFIKEVIALDPEEEQVTLAVGPNTTAGGFTNGNIINNTTIVWTPTTSGFSVIELIATDPQGNETSHIYNIQVADNASPNISSLGNLGPAFFNMPADYEYIITLEVKDPNENDTVSLHLYPEAEELGMTITPHPSEADQWQVRWNKADIESNATLDSTVRLQVAARDNHFKQSRIWGLDIPIYDANAVPSYVIDGDFSYEVDAGKEFNMQSTITYGGTGTLKQHLKLVDDEGVVLDVPSDYGIVLSSGGNISWTPDLSLLKDPELPSDSTINRYVDAREFKFQLVSYVEESPETSTVRALTITVTNPGISETRTASIDLQASPFPLFATANQELAYKPVVRFDQSVPDTLTRNFNWYLEAGPEGMKIDRLTGRLTWTPSEDFVGQEVPVTIRTQVPGGGARISSFTLGVAGSNQPPEIKGIFPSIWSTTFGDFSYQIKGLDPEGHELEYFLRTKTDLGLPDGLSIDSSTGEILWSNPVVGTHILEVYAQEKFHPESVSAIRDFELKVSADPVNRIPIILNSPEGHRAGIGEEFSFQFSVLDHDQPVDSDFIYELSGVSESIDSADYRIDSNGLFTWTPRKEGAESFTLVVKDTPLDLTQGNTAITFSIEAIDNSKPLVKSESVVATQLGSSFVHWVEAVDPDQKELRYSLVDDGNLPVGLTIDEFTGVIRWETPTTSPVPDVTSVGYDLTVMIEDEDGLFLEHELTIDLVIEDVDAPQINFYITDENGDVVLPSDHLQGDQFEDYTLWLTIEDNLGNDDLYWVLEVYDSGGLNVPGVNKTITTDTRGGLISTRFTQGFNSGLLYFKLTAGDGEAPIDWQNDSSLSAESMYNGEGFTGNKSTRTFRYQAVSEIQSNYAQLVNVDSAEGVLVIDDRFEVTGKAKYEIAGGGSGSFSSYDLKLVSTKDPENFVYVQKGTTADRELGSVLGTIDPTLISSGQYRLYLEVRSTTEDNCDCIAGIDEQIVEIRNDSKLGNLDLSFTDLTTDLGGIPISLQRSYSSASVGTNGSALKSDFGPGWSLNYLQSSVELGHPNQVTSSLADPLAEQTRFWIKLPSGQIERFEFFANQLSSSEDAPYRPVFLADPDVTSTLELVGLSDRTLLTYNNLRKDGSFVESSTGEEFTPANFASRVKLTTREGIEYLFNITTGQLEAIQDRNDRRVIIERDEANNRTIIKTDNNLDGVDQEQVVIKHAADTGFITKIVAPQQANTPGSNEIIYEYGDYNSDSGIVSGDSLNLSSVTDRAEDIVYYDYENADFANHLTHIYDNDHNKVLEATYYSAGVADNMGVTDVGAGRLKSLVDASGELADIGFTIDLGDGRMVTRVTTAGQPPVDEVVDNRGNVLRRVQLIDAGVENDGTDNSYLVTASIYNINGTLERQSVPFTVTGAANRYDELPISDPNSAEYSDADWANVLTYYSEDARSNNLNVKTSTNALGQTTTYEYDDQDRVIKTIGPDSIVIENVYHTYTGNLLETFSYPVGKPEEKFNHTSYKYSNGRITRSIQHDGDKQLVISETGYNNYGRVAWSKDASGNYTYFHYDNVGNQTHSWSVWHDPTGGLPSVATVSVTEYDANDRVKLSKTIEVNFDSSAITLDNYLDLDSVINTGLLISSTQTIYDNKGRVEKTISHHGVESISVYDIRGQVIESRTSGKDANDNQGWTVTRTLYDAQGRVEFTTDPYFVTGLTYDLTNTSVPWYGSRTVYDELGRSVASQRWSGIELSIAQNADTSTPEVSLPVGFDWDSPSSGSMLTESQTGYNDLGRVEYTVNESNARTDYYYNAAGQQIAVLNPIVDINGTLTRHLTFSVYNHAGRLTDSVAGIAVTHAVQSGLEGHPSIAVSHRILSSDDSDLLIDHSSSLSTYYEYDVAGRQIAVLTPRFDHDQNNATESIHLRTETGYDNLGRRISSTSGLTQRSPYAPETINRTEARTTEYEYDEQGRLIAVNLPEEYDATIEQEVKARYEYGYDDYGNRITIRDNAFKLGADVYYDHGGQAYHPDTYNGDHDTRVTQFTYDHRGSQTSRTLPLGTMTSDPEDFIEKMTFGTTPLDSIPAVDREHSIAIGQLEISTDVDGRITAYRYDNSPGGSGRLTAKYYYGNATDYDGDATSGTFDSYQEAVFYSYDEFGREIHIDIDRDGVQASIEHATTRKYNDEGRLTQVATPEGVINYGYDPATGQQVSVWTTDLATPDDPIASAITATEYTYDSLGRLSSVESKRRYSTDITGEVTSYEYDLLGNLSRVTAPNGVIADYQYDFLSRLIDLVHYKDSNGNDQYDDTTTDQLVARYEYELDVHGKRIASTDTDANGGAANYDWVYDDLGRLVEERFDYDADPNTPSDTDSHDYTTRFEYDLVGNRISQEIDRGNDAVVDEALSYEYDKNDRLLIERVDNDSDDIFEQTTFYQYDNGDGDSDYFDGTVQTKKEVFDDDHSVYTTDGSTPTSTTSYTYNVQGRLESVNQDGTLSEYEFNDDGFRVTQTVDGEKTIYLVNANNQTGYTQILEEKDATGVVTKTYVIGHDVLLEAASATAYNWLVYDGHGSTRALLDQNAAVSNNSSVAQLFAYTAYGKLINLPGYASHASQALMTLLYSGEQTDGTGMQYLRARYYDPGTGRFNRVDPFAGNHEDPQSLHKYAYVHGDPINGIDPSGNFLSFFTFAALNAITIGVAGALALIQEYHSEAFILSNPRLMEQVNPTGLWYGGVGGFNASYGIAGLELSGGRLTSLSDPQDTVDINNISISSGLGFGLTAGLSLALAFNARSVEDINNADGVGLDARLDFVFSTKTFLKIGTLLFDIDTLKDIARGVASAVEVAQVTEKLREGLDIPFGKPTVLTLPLPLATLGIQAYLGVKYTSVNVTGANV